MNKKQGICETSIFAVKILLCILFVFNFLIFVYYGLINRGDELDIEPVNIVENWKITDETVNDSDERNITVCTTLPSGIEENEYFFFSTRKDVYIYINGELRKDFIETRDVNISGGSVKSFYMMVPLKKSDSGAEIKIVKKVMENDDEYISHSFVSTRFAAFFHLMQNEGLSFMLATIVLIFSFVVFIVSIVLRFLFRTKINMTYGSLGIFIISAYILTDSYVFPFIFGVYHVNGILNYIYCLMIPIAPSIYLNSVQRGRYNKFVSIMLVISVVNAVIWPILHFTGLVPFYKMRTVGNLILIGIAISAISLFIIEAIKKNVGEYRYTFIGFFVFIACSVTELVLIILVTSDVTIPMVVGLASLLVFVVIQQVDDLHKINMEKQHAIDISEAKTRFLASMSHEIRTPINAILGMNEMIIRENRDQAIGEYSRNIKTSGKMLLMLVNDVLDFSKIEAGKLEIKDSAFDMDEMLRDVYSLVKERADEKSLKLEVNILDEIPNEVISDEFRIRQILVNLINNAVKYTEKGVITLSLGGAYTENDFRLKLLVKDTGKGIRKEDQTNLFDAFSRADIKSNVNIEGTGLGLAIVKSIVESMNGTIGLESEYGKGSLFWVELPIRYNSKKPIEKNFLNAVSEQEKDTETCEFYAPDAKILVVDDNQSNLTIVKLFLKRSGIIPDLCNSGKLAIELCRKNKYDLILLDHMMPQPDGIETLHIIRNDMDSMNRATKAVVLTANAVVGSRQMYLAEGFDDYLTKPLDPKALEQAVRNMLPKEKLLEIDNDILEFPEQNESSLKSRLAAIEGLNYNMMLGYCGDDEAFLKEIITDIVADCSKRSGRMKKNLEEKDFKNYQIEAHSVKSTMATIGMKDLSDRAKKHEFAARDNNIEFILEDAEGFITEYIEICKKLQENLK